jgi:AhpD family alkylhydroperoxidase
MRIDLYRSWPEGYHALRGLNAVVDGCELEPHLLELVKLRASQMNQSAYCIEMHSKDARTTGESERRIYALSSWRDSTLYTERERAALELTEAITLLGDEPLTDELLDAVRCYFDDAEVSMLVFAVVEANAWNRLVAVIQPPVGGYVAQPKPRARTERRAHTRMSSVHAGR